MIQKMHWAMRACATALSCLKVGVHLRSKVISSYAAARLNLTAAVLMQCVLS